MVAERETVTAAPGPGEEELRDLLESQKKFDPQDVDNKIFIPAIFVTFCHLIKNGRKDSALNILNEALGENPITAKQQTRLAEIDALINKP